jgi:hypothetical protein
MPEVIRFVPKSKRKQAHLISIGPTMHDSISRPGDPVSEQQDKAPVSYRTSGANAHRSDEVLL